LDISIFNKEFWFENTIGLGREVESGDWIELLSKFRETLNEIRLERGIKGCFGVKFMNGDLLFLEFLRFFGELEKGNEIFGNILGDYSFYTSLIRGSYLSILKLAIKLSGGPWLGYVST
jgi:hypothetical protein